jgi:hypothetical protein
MDLILRDPGNRSAANNTQPLEATKILDLYLQAMPLPLTDCVYGITIPAWTEQEQEQEQDPTIGNLATTFTSALRNNLVIDVEGASTVAGAHASVWTQHDNANQRFVLVPDGNGYYWITNVQSGMALDVEGANGRAGAAIIQWPKHNGDNQKWKLIDLGNLSFNIVSKLDETLCLDVTGASSRDGARLVLWPLGTGKANQIFGIHATTPSDSVPYFGTPLDFPIASALGTNLFADIKSNSRSNGANVILWPLVLTANNQGIQQNQMFRFVYDETTGYYTIHTFGGTTNKVLDISGGSAKAGASVIQWPLHGGMNQQWRIEDAGNGFVYIRSAINGYALDVSGASAKGGANLIVWPFHGGTNQKWVVIFAQG